MSIRLKDLFVTYYDITIFKVLYLNYSVKLRVKFV